MNIVILGEPASGKGTQAALISKEFNLYHLQTGDIARRVAEKDERIREIINSGKLIPEEEMSLYVMDLLHQKQADMKDILFEGFPRFISQYEALKNYLKNKGDDIDAIFSLELGQDEAVKRISLRRICGKCGEVFNSTTNPPKNDGLCDKCGEKLIQRADDMPEAIKTRFEYYKNNTKTLIDYLDKEGKLIKINGARPIQVVFEDIKKHIYAISSH